MKKIMRLAGIVLMTAVIILLFARGIGRMISIRKSDQQESEEALRIARDEMTRAATILNQKLEKYMALTDSAARLLTEGIVSPDSVEEMLEGMVQQNPEIYGAGAYYEPWSYSKTQRIYGPYWIRPEDQMIFVRVDTSYDYTESNWYQRPLQEGPGWYAPYWARVGKQFVAEYSRPWYRINEAGEKVPAGVILTDLSLSGLYDIVNQLEIGKAGYGFVLSKAGTFIAHPVSEWLKDEKNIREFAGENQAPEVVELAETGKTDGKDYLEIENAQTGQRSMILMKEIAASGWKLGVVFMKDSFHVDYGQRNIQRIGIAANFIAACSLLLLLAAGLWSHSTKVLWMASIGISLIFIAGIGYAWYLKLETPPHAPKSTIINDRAVLNNYLLKQDSLSIRQHEKRAIRIPTGLFVEHIEFEKPNTINLSGILWQEYDSAQAATLEKGVYFPQISPTSEIGSVRQLYSKASHGKVTIGWAFRAALRHKFDYSAYPFDHHTISVSLWHPDLEHNILLIPDLASYSIINPALLPGLHEDFVMPGWKIKSSYFDFQERKYTTTFGVKSSFTNHQRPELNFNVVIKRKFLGPFISNFIPLIVISLLLFTVIMTATSQELSASRLGFSGFGVLELSAAFFFVVILSQIDLRNTLNIQTIIYLDYFYFMIYFKLLLFSVNSILFSRADRIHFIHHKDNLYPRLLYWPVFLGALLVITWMVFY